MVFRPFDVDRDLTAARRIWREVGWWSSDRPEAVDEYIMAGRGWVAELDGEAECLVISAPGTVRYQTTDLPFAAVTGVTTSRVARKQGLAKRLAAQVVAEDVAAGAVVSGLGMFEQGFYNQLGFGSLPYQNVLRFDPDSLRVKTGARPPKRLTTADAEAMHAARLARHRGHGAVNLTPVALTRLETTETKDFGLGYWDRDRLTHHLWVSPKDVESGPYRVAWMAWETREQLLELLALLRHLSDQVTVIELTEPPGIQLQDLIDKPLRQRQVRAGSRHPCDFRTGSFGQMRLNDLAAGLAATHLPGDPVRFNLVLDDPVTPLLPDDAPWRGAGGEYVVTLGPDSAAERGSHPSLPALRATVNAFTRLWLGVRPATGLAVTDDLVAADDLLRRLDEALRLPQPQTDWEY